MSRKGNCSDNGPGESGFNRVKNERVPRERVYTCDLMEATAFDYMKEFFRRKRLYSNLGYASPVHFPRDWINLRQGE
ncbi:hypothetical protein [Thiocapsa marina]|uniref:ISRSO8-transposase orfB protein n=1 Tax=Thiocapsa marina 5811 TaxID=768671 RepID=F9UAS9_9GAMM|nr:hypothetical protein [Thiocapsa marina]EGV18547.1 ISRSO8-transposase orfB protein [Thiocapsa marina 5811]